MNLEKEADELAYRFWSLHPKELDSMIHLSNDKKGGRRAAFYSQEIMKLAMKYAEHISKNKE